MLSETSTPAPSLTDTLALSVETKAELSPKLADEPSSSANTPPALESTKVDTATIESNCFFVILKISIFYFFIF